MSNIRRSVPVLVTAGIIAAGVIAIAFGFRPEGNAATPSSASASAVIDTVVVERGTIRSIVVLDGVAVPTPFSTIDAPASGVIEELMAAVGDSVIADEALGRVRPSAGNPVIVNSPAGGVISSWSVSVGDEVRRGDALGHVDPGSFQADAVVAPELLYRFYGPPISVTVKLDKGPAPFECPFASLGAPISGNETDPSVVPVHLKCWIPEDVRVFAGVRVKLAAVTGEAPGVLVLPLQTIAGESDRGLVTLVDAEGRTSQRDVVLGLTDGVNIEIVEGLSEGDRVAAMPVDGQSIPTP